MEVLNGRVFILNFKIESIYIKTFIRRILLFPRGNNDNNSIALYLDCAPTDENDPNWSVCAQFILAIHSPSDDKVYVMNCKLLKKCYLKEVIIFTNLI